MGDVLLPPFRLCRGVREVNQPHPKEEKPDGAVSAAPPKHSEVAPSAFRSGSFRARRHLHCGCRSVREGEPAGVSRRGESPCSFGNRSSPPRVVDWSARVLLGEQYEYSLSYRTLHQSLGRLKWQNVPVTQRGWSNNYMGEGIMVPSEDRPWWAWHIICYCPVRPNNKQTNKPSRNLHGVLFSNGDGHTGLKAFLGLPKGGAHFMPKTEK